MGVGISTIGTVLKYGASANELTKLCNIKTYPQLMGAPNQLETTDLEDESQTYTNGVQSVDTMEFTANYTKTAFSAVNTSANTPGYYCLEMGDDGADGKFSWQGTHSVYKNGEGVDAVREMTIVCSPSTKITFS